MNSPDPTPATPPLLSFACPLSWTKMSGTEQSKFCSQCGHHVRNLSLMTPAERAALLQQAKTERICGTYLMRLSGEMVTPASPLTRSEWSRVRQFGLAALSAGALALASGCVAPAPTNSPTVAEAPVARAGAADSKSPSENKTVALETKKSEEEIVLFMGIVASDNDDKPVQAQVMY